MGTQPLQEKWHLHTLFLNAFMHCLLAQQIYHKDSVSQVFSVEGTIFYLSFITIMKPPEIRGRYFNLFSYFNVSFLQCPGCQLRTYLILPDINEFPFAMLCSHHSVSAEGTLMVPFSQNDPRYDGSNKCFVAEIKWQKNGEA